jgi:hypothetical protein
LALLVPQAPKRRPPHPSPLPPEGGEGELGRVFALSAAGAGEREGAHRERDGEGEVAGRGRRSCAAAHLTPALSPQRAEREN